MKSKILPVLVFLSFIIFSTFSSFGQTSWIGTTSTNWATSSNWTAGVPTASTDVIIGDINFTGGFQPSISATATAKSLTIGSTVVSQLTVSNPLTVSGNVSINSNGAINSTANLSIYGNLATSGAGAYSQSSGTLIMTAPNTTITGGNLLFNNIQIDREIITNSTMTITGDLNCGSGFTQTAGVLSMTGTSKTMIGRMAFNDLVIAGSIAATLPWWANTPTIAGNLTVNTGSSFTVTGGEFNMTGTNKTISNAGTLSLSGLLISGSISTASSFTNTGVLYNTGSFVATAGTITFTNVNSQNYLEGTVTLYNVIISSTTLYLKTNVVLNISNSMTSSAGTLYATWQTPTTVKYNGSNQTVLGSNYDSLVLSNGGTKTAGASILVNKVLTIDPATTFDASTYTHNINGNLVNNGTIAPGTSTIEFDQPNTTLTISGTGVQNFYTLSVNRGYVSVDPSVTSLNVAGNLYASGGFTQTSGTLVMSGTSKTMKGRMTLNNVDISGSLGIDLSGGVNTAAIAGNLNVNTGNSLTVINGEIWMTGANKTITNTGTLTFSGLVITGSITTASSFTLYGALTNTGTFTASAGTVTFTSTGGQNYFDGTVSLYNIAINNTTLYLKTNVVLAISNSITTSSGGLYATWQTPTTVIYNGGNQTILGANYHYLTLSNGSTKTAAARIVVEKTFTIDAGTTFNAGTYTHNVNGNWINNGVLVPVSSTIAFDAPSISIAGNGIQNFYNLTVERYNVTTDAPIINIAGNLDGSAGFTHTAGLLTMTGTGKYITGNVAFNNLTIAGTITLFSPGATNTTMAGDLTINAAASLTANDGKLTMSGTNKTITNSGSLVLKELWISGTISTSSNFTIDLSLTATSTGIFSATAGTATFTTQAGNRQTYINGPGSIQLHSIYINNADVILRDVYLKISGAVTSILLGNFDPTSNSNTTVEYNGTINQTIVGTGYQALVISNTGTKTPAASIIVYKDFLITSPATFNASSYEHTFYANWINNGFFVAGTSTITFRGSANATITGPTTFDKLIVWKDAVTNTVTLLNDCTTTDTKTDRGKLCTGTLTLTTTTVSNAHASNGWIIGNLKKYFAVGSNVEKTFELGDTNNYLPDTVKCAVVTSAGYITASITPTEHTNIDFSGIDKIKDVNRYWTFINAGIVFTTATASLKWVTGDVGPGATTANFRTVSYNGSSWTLQTSASPLSTSIQVTGLTSFGSFAVGERLTETTWTGASLTTDWFTPNNWYGHLPDATVATLIPAALQPGRFFPILNAGGIATVNNITIEAGASLTVSGATLQVAGTIANAGTLTASAGTIEFNGSSLQTIAANCFTGNSLQNLLINNNVTLAGTVAITGTLTIGTSNKTFSTGGYLTLKSNALGTARIAPLPVNGAGTATSFIMGLVTVERFIPQHRSWRLVTAPLSNTGFIYNSWQNGGVYDIGKGMFVTGPNPSVANGLDGSSYNNVSMKSFNSTTQAFSNVINTKTTNLSNTGAAGNIGYFVFIRGDRNPNNLFVPNKNLTTLSASGTIQTGKQIFAASHVLNAFTLIGNPYASPVDFNNVQRTHIRKRFYAWDATINELGGYVVLDDIDGNGTFSTSDSSSMVDQNIQSGQAFFVETDTAGTASLTFSESSKSTVSSNAGFRPLNDGKSLAIRLNLLQPDQSVIKADAVLAEFHPNFNGRVDYQDAIKFTNVDETFSLQRNGVGLAMERRPLIVANDTLFFKLIQSTPRNYQLAFNANNLEQPNLVAFLQDSYTGLATKVNLQGYSSINFTIDATAASAKPDRFRVIFKTAAVLPVDFSDVKAQQQGDNIAVLWEVQNQLNVQRYEVEKSTDGNNFTKANSQSVIGTNTSSTYNWLDTHAAAGDNFYRIRNIDRDGTSTYSKIVKVNKGKATSAIAIYPNPIANGIARLQLRNMPRGKYGLQLFNTLGEQLLTKEISHAGGNATEKIVLPNQLPKGIYNLEITGPDNSKTFISVIKE